MITHYTIRVVAKGSTSIFKTVRKNTLKEAKKEAHNLLHSWRDAGVRIEILRHEVSIIR